MTRAVATIDLGSSYFLRGARQVLTLRGPASVRRGAALRDLAIISDGSVLIKNGRIVSVGPTRRIENLREARLAQEIPVYGKIVMPGFIDVGVQLSLIRAGRVRPLRVIEFSEESLMLMRSFLAHGTLAVRVHASAEQPLSAPDVTLLQKLGRIGDRPVQMLRTWRVPSTPPEDYLATLEKLQKRRTLESVSVTVSGSDEVHWERLEAFRDAGERLNVVWNGGSERLLGEVLERLQPASVCACRLLTPEEAALLARAGGTTVLPAGKQVLEGNAGSAVRQMVDAGAALALSTGYDSACAPNVNMQMSIALAVARFGLTAEEAITAATFNAACAANCADRIGSIEIGKQADLLVLNISDGRDLATQFGTNHVAVAFRAGEIVFNRMRKREPAEPAANRMRAKSV